MKRSKRKPAKPMHLKRKLLSALSMLLVSTILLTTTSYAWFVLSTAPEVTGITTNIGSNGSLEIALLNTETHTDMETIRSGAVGNSLAANDVSANYAWGNLIDLGFGSFGLDTVVLMPARLNTISAGDGYAVDSGMLAVPTYGYDGRVVDLTDNTMSAVYQGTGFALNAGVQDYGVRAIGTASDLSAQGSALALAKSNIVGYTNSAKAGVRSLMAESTDSLMGIVILHSTTDSYTDEHRDSIKTMLTKMQTNVGYIDLALRQGIVAYAASQIADEMLFNTVKDTVMAANSVSEAVDALGEDATVPGAYAEWIDTFDSLNNRVNAALNACNALTGGTYTWAEIRGVLNYLMDMDKIYLGDSLFGDLTADQMMGLMGGSITMTLAPGSGAFADIADFIDNVSTQLTYMGSDITITTASTQNPAYLTALSELVSGLTSATGGDSSSSALTLTTTYGYALDLGFRCNAANADLLLQTTPEQRVYESSSAASTQGGGSYMEFTSTDDSFPLDKRLMLMDAIRVGFLDNQNNILGIAKLNTSNRSVEDGVITAPLYLYDYAFEADACGNYLVMGERRNTENQLTTLTQNVPTALTVIVWLDGDIVDNTMVSATAAASLGGMLNLQFSTNAQLIPSENDDLLHYKADKSGLVTLLQEHTDTANAGQGTYTNVSWNSFISAYTRAVTLSETNDPSMNQVRSAMLALRNAADALTEVSQEPVREQILTLRDSMGTTDGTAYYLIKDEMGNIVTAGQEEFTQEEYENWDKVGSISGVDNTMNLHDEGNGIYTNIYSAESWNTLAEALYNAELVVADENATDDQLNAALTNLEEAQKSLERQVYYKPYEYKGAIYYEAICDAANADTYGKWYDSNFKRIVSDITILNLDAYAEPADITEIGQTTYISHEETHVTPNVTLLDGVYTELSDDSFQGVKWDTLDDTLFEEGLSQRHIEALSQWITRLATDEMFRTKTEDKEFPDPTSEDKNAKKIVAMSRLESRWPSYINGLEIFDLYADAVDILHKEENPALYPNENRVTLAEVQPLLDAMPGAYDAAYEAYEEFYYELYEQTNGKPYEPPMYETTRILLTKAIGTADAFLEELEAADQKAKEEWENAKNPAQPDATEPAASEPAASEPEAAEPTESTPAEGGEPMAASEPAASEPAASEPADDGSTGTAKEPDYRMDDEDIVALKTSLEAAKTTLNGSDTLEKDASEKLEDLNAKLEAAGSKPATEYNTMTQKLPSTGTSGNIYYATEYPEITMNLKGQTGVTTLGAQIVTQNGVVVTVKKDVVVYNKADGVEIVDALDPNVDIAPTELSKAEGAVFSLSSRLFYNEYKATLGADGQTVAPGKEIPAGEILEAISLKQEDLKKITWASSDTKLATVTKNDDGSCTVTVAVSDHEKNFVVTGKTVIISMSVETVQGNTYYCQIPVTLTLS